MTKTKTSILAMIIAVAAIGLLTSTISVSNSADAQQEAIPEWIQNVALFWGQGDISESEFVNALEFLGDEGILKLPAAKSAEAQEISASIGELEQRIEQVEAKQITSTEPTSIAPTPEIEPEDTGYPTTFAICPSNKIRHFDKVYYEFIPDSGNFASAVYLYCPNGDRIPEGERGVMILEEKYDEINQQIYIKERLLDQLHSNGCYWDQDAGGVIEHKLDKFNIEIIDIDYAAVCANKPGISESGTPGSYK